LKKHVIMALKIGFSAGLLALIATRIDFDQAIDRAFQVSPLAFFAAICIAVLQIFWISGRLHIALAELGSGLRLGALMRTQLLGAFVGQAFLTFVAGDGARVVNLARDGVPFGRAVQAVLIDRVFGLAALTAAALAASLPLWPMLHAAHLRAGVGLTLSACSLGLAILLALHHLPLSRAGIRAFVWAEELSGLFSRFAVSPRISGPMIALGLLVQLGSVISLTILANGLGLKVSLLDCLILTPVPLLLAALPVSLAGWGVREGSLVLAFSLIAVPAEQTIAVSILFGLSHLIASLPGAIVWISGPREGPAPNHQTAL
jgi:glycosyltransferase 2 family protein